MMRERSHLYFLIILMYRIMYTDNRYEADTYAFLFLAIDCPFSFLP
jgi:hypothetical protein